MTYSVLSGTLSLYTTTTEHDDDACNAVVIGESS